MRYIPNNEPVRQAMLREIGLETAEDLFRSIPAAARLTRPLHLAPGLSEPDHLERFHDWASSNSERPEGTFLGAGSYPHFSPLVINALVQRAEFLTAYTPYQPEVAQGTLQAIFEFQSFMTLLTGMDVCNASMYDGASATAEAVLMSERLTGGQKKGRTRVLLAGSLHPNYRAVIDTHTRYQTLALQDVPPDAASGQIDLAALEAALQGRQDEQVACVVIQQPNFYGVVEDIAAVAERTKAAGALLVVSLNEALSLALLEAPGKLGADVVVGEAQSFGVPVAFGGPYLGFMALRDAYKRQLPGRIAGETVDADGLRGYVLTLATREQHIRRERATSNICTNQNLVMLSALIHLTLLGREGLQRAARHNVSLLAYFKEQLGSLPGYAPLYSGAVFNEMTVQCPRPAAEVVAACGRQGSGAGIVPGLDLGRYDAARSHQLLVAVTETKRRKDVDALIAALREAA